MNTGYQGRGRPRQTGRETFMFKFSFPALKCKHYFITINRASTVTCFCMRPIQEIYTDHILNITNCILNKTFKNKFLTSFPMGKIWKITTFNHFYPLFTTFDTIINYFQSFVSLFFSPPIFPWIHLCQPRLHKASLLCSREGLALPRAQFQDP